MTTADTPDPDPTPARSLAAKLRDRYGCDLDPRIDLVAGPQPAAKPSTSPPSRPPSTTGATGDVLHRLVERSGAASRYRVAGEIARGGMGAILEVFDEDLRRRLAMKVILERGAPANAGGSTRVEPTTLARFLEEAQVTGQLDHPGIVPVHELGLDGEGRVYFTMRLVHGRDLESIFDLVARGDEGWTVPRALGVLLKVCEAVAYAHEKGVVHRDLKPANVMVGRFGEVYVMDWGLARVRGRSQPARPVAANAGPVRDAAAAPVAEPVATDRKDAAASTVGSELHTMDGDVIGTPSYMAPEQARGDTERLDERADVYAVGAMLYRLLAGRAPYTEPGERAPAATLWRRVLAGPPAGLAGLAPEAPGELIAICERAMAREVGERYAGMLPLAEELRAFLEGRVVQAFATGAWATAKKWMQRNRALAAALALAVTALAVGLVASLLFAERARDSARLAESRRLEATASAELAERRRVEAEGSAEVARQQARIAATVSSFLNDDLLAALAPEHDGRDVTVQQVLDMATLRLGGQFAEDPETEAALRTTIGTSYHRLGDFDAAAAMLERALELRQQRDGTRGEGVLQSLRSVAALQADRGASAASIETYRKALAIAEAELGPEHRGTLSTRTDLAKALAQSGELESARELLEPTLTSQRRLLGETHVDTLTSRNNLAQLDLRQGRLHAAAAGFEAVLQMRRRIDGDRDPETLVVATNLGMALAELGQLDAAERLGREVLTARRALYGDEHPLVAHALGNLGTFLHRRGRSGDAQPLFREALQIFRQRLGDDSPQVLQAEHNLAASLDAPADFDTAVTMLRKVIEGRRRVLGADHVDTLESINSLAARYYVASRAADAEPLYREALAGFERVRGPDHPRTIGLRENLGGALLSLGQHEASEAMTREVLAARIRVLGERHPDVARTLLNLSVVQSNRGDLAGALVSIDDALARTREAFGEEHLQVAVCLRTRGDLRRKGKQWQPAIDDYRAALELRRRLRPDDEDAVFLLYHVAFCEAGLGRHAEAEQSYAAAVTAGEAIHGPDRGQTRSALLQRVRSLIALGRHEDAERLALDLLARATRDRGEGSEAVTRARELLVQVYEAWGRPDDAAKWR
ncbi:MAG: serine/threonine-protein kinase [Planctomycetes bacterium]|nr:serine/threonine-protein kinase [Planctomycetota bacterium]